MKRTRCHLQARLGLASAYSLSAAFASCRPVFFFFLTAFCMFLASTTRMELISEAINTKLRLQDVDRDIFRTFIVLKRSRVVSLVV